MKTYNIFIIFLLSLFILSCGTIRESAGVNRKVIDEYTIIENPPLVIPPNFNLLPPDQLESRNIDEVEADLAKEILFGLNEDEKIDSENPNLLNEILNKTNANKINNKIREEINEEFAGEKSSLSDEINFKNEEELNQAINETNKKINNETNKNKLKKNKRFFFFNSKEENEDEEEDEPKKKKRFFFF